MRDTTPLLVLASATAIAIGSSASAESSFEVDLTDLGGNQWQLTDQFTINYNLMTAYPDLDQNGTVDMTMDTSGEPWATPSFDGVYTDPNHYVLSFNSDVYFMGSQMSIDGAVDWTLSYTSTAGDASTIYSTILFGTMETTGMESILSIRDGIEWPVSGDQGSPATRIGFAINDFNSFTYDAEWATLNANMIPVLSLIHI